MLVSKFVPPLSCPTCQLHLLPLQDGRQQIGPPIWRSVRTCDKQTAGCSDLRLHRAPSEHVLLLDGKSSAGGGGCWWASLLPPPSSPLSLSVPSIPPAPSLHRLPSPLPSSAGVSGPSRAADCLWQPRYFKSGVWAKLEWAIPPVPAEGPLWFALLLRWEEPGGGGRGGREGGKKAATCNHQSLCFTCNLPSWLPCEESWMFAAPSLSPSPLTSSFIPPALLLTLCSLSLSLSLQVCFFLSRALTSFASRISPPRLPDTCLSLSLFFLLSLSRSYSTVSQRTDCERNAVLGCHNPSLQTDQSECSR